MSAKPRKKQAPRALVYKVIELSTVDESAIERTLNAWTAQGWTLESIQFAMRESSKRPSMAFVLFTREGRAVKDSAVAKAPAAVTAWDRLAQLAGEDDA